MSRRRARLNYRRVLAVSLNRLGVGFRMKPAATELLTRPRDG